MNWTGLKCTCIGRNATRSSLLNTVAIFRLSQFPLMQSASFGFGAFCYSYSSVYVTTFRYFLFILSSLQFLSLLYLSLFLASFFTASTQTVQVRAKSKVPHDRNDLLVRNVHFLPKAKNRLQFQEKCILQMCVLQKTYAYTSNSELRNSSWHLQQVNNFFPEIEILFSSTFLFRKIQFPKILFTCFS